MRPCTREGYKVLEAVSDPGPSGASLKRPGMGRKRDLVAAGSVSVVLAQDRDHFAREPAYLFYLREEFAEHRTELRTLNDRGGGSPEGLEIIREKPAGSLGRRGRARSSRLSVPTTANATTTLGMATRCMRKRWASSPESSRMVGVRGPKPKLRNKAKLLAVTFGNPRDIDVYAHRSRNTTA